jgi:hypothetical protein
MEEYHNGGIVHHGGNEFSKVLCHIALPLTFQKKYHPVSAH